MRPSSRASAPSATPTKPARRRAPRSAPDTAAALVRAKVSVTDRLPAQVIQVLGRRVVAGTYPEGEALPNEGLLCEELGVSRTALREGLKVLGAKGLLVARPRVGTRVLPRAQWQVLDADVLAWQCELPPDDAFVAQLTEMREIIEPAAAGLAARNRDEHDLAAIESAFLRMKKSRSQSDWVAADFDFHQALLRATGNAFLVPLGALIGSALESVLTLAAVRTRESAQGFKVALPEHERVLEAVRRADPAAAQAAMTYLLSDTRRRLWPVATDKVVKPRRGAAVATAGPLKQPAGVRSLSTRRKPG